MYHLPFSHFNNNYYRAFDVTEALEGEAPAVLGGGTAPPATGETDVARGPDHVIVTGTGHVTETGGGVTLTRRRERNRPNLRMSECIYVYLHVYA